MKDDYTGVLLEDIKDQNQKILESLAPLPQMGKDITQLQEDVSELKTDMKAVKTLVKEHSGQLNNHESRISTLETVPQPR